MAKPKGVNQKAKWRAHSIRLAKYAGRVQAVYDTLNKEVASSVVKTDYEGSKPFRFSDYPLTKKKFEEVQAAFVRDLRSVVYSGTSEEWKQSNLVQDLLVDKVLKFYGVKEKGKKHKVYYQVNNDALKAFQQRKDNGMGLSERLWNQSKDYKIEMEHAISSAIEKGTSAVKLSKRLSKYLEDYPSLKKDYKEKFGKAVTCKDCEYRSIRLARSEINMAYRKAEQERWKQFDFVLGYEVKTTQNGRHEEDICDELAGKYPKDFVFLGWHPNCMCYVIPVLKSEDQFFNDEEAEPITEPPKGFNDWLRKNAERIDKAAENGTLPYWYTDNEKYVRKVSKNDFAFPSFNTCKSVEGYAELAQTLPFVRSVQFEDCSLPSAEKITRQLFELGRKFELPMESGGLDVFTWFEYTKGNSKTGSLGSFDRFGKQKLGIASNSDRIINRQVAKQKSNMLKREKEMIAQTEKNIEALKQTIKENSYMGDDPWLVGQKDLLARAEGYHKQLVADLAEKEKGFIPSLDTTARKLEDVVTHEFGHFINDNIRRNWELYPERVKEVIIKIEKELGYVADRPNRIWEFNSHFLDSVAFEKGRQISFYASTEGCEYFAEAFVTYCKTGTSKNELLDELFNALKRK